VAHLFVEAAQVVEVLEGQGVAGDLDGAGAMGAVEQALRARTVDFVGDPARHQLIQQRVQPTGGAGCCSGLNCRVRSQERHGNRLRRLGIST